jgi:4-amino-4-deoxy-L-arabinose transferase-like glycosyltransferase
MHLHKNNLIICLGIFLVGLGVFTRGLNTHGLEFRDDEIFYYKSTQEMLSNENFFSPTYFGNDRFQKPILFYWLVLFSYHFGGVSWFSARMVAVIFASSALVIVWLLAKDLFNKRVANASALILATMPLFSRHAKNVVPDMVLNFFVLVAIYFGCKLLQAGRSVDPPCGSACPERSLKSYQMPPRHYSLLFFVACSLGFMVKGFVAFIVPLIAIGGYALATKRVKALFPGNLWLNFAVMGVIILPWFLYMITVHGLDYLRYMLVRETQQRILNDSGGYTWWSWVKMVGDHILYYGGVIFSYHAPWSLFLLGAFPLAVQRSWAKRGRSPQSFLLIWICGTVLFFSSLYFVINHYMLVVSAPLAILISFFLLETLPAERILCKITDAFRRYAMIFLFVFGFLVFSFLYFILLQGSVYWIPVFAFVFILSFRIMWVNPNYRRVLFLGIFILGVMSQSRLLNEANLTSHAVLSRFARVIKAGEATDFSIGVGSHDLHEKEFQVYFDQKVDKASVSWEWGMQNSLNRYFSRAGTIYCLITAADYQAYLNNIPHFDKVSVVSEDYIFRRRVRLDGHFWKALGRFDQQKMFHYFMEKIILVKKE